MRSVTRSRTPSVDQLLVALPAASYANASRTVVPAVREVRRPRPSYSWLTVRVPAPVQVAPGVRPSMTEVTRSRAS